VASAAFDGICALRSVQVGPGSGVVSTFLAQLVAENPQDGGRRSLPAWHMYAARGPLWMVVW
jgi:hypothetical protein